MPTDVLFVTAKNPIPDALLGSPLVGDVAVVTDAASIGVAPPGARVATVPDVRDVASVVERARRLYAGRTFDRVLSPGERGVPAAGAVRSDLGLPGTPAATARAFSDKYLMKVRLQDGGVSTTPFALADSLDEVPGVAARLGWPVVLKPLYGGGADDVVRVDAADHLALLRRARLLDGLASSPWSVMVERYVHLTTEFHCDAVVHNGCVAFAATARYFLPMLGYHTDLTGTIFLHDDHPDREGLLRLNEQAITALGLTDGVTHLEAFGTTDGLLVGEIACRPAGATVADGIGMQWGVDLWDAYLRTELGLAPNVTPVRSSGTLATVWLPVRPGRVVALTQADRLLGLEGVETVEMDHKVGDVIGHDLHSASRAGAVFVRGKDMTEALARVENVRDAYVLDVEPV